MVYSISSQYACENIINVITYYKYSSPFYNNKMDIAHNYTDKYNFDIHTDSSEIIICDCDVYIFLTHINDEIVVNYSITPCNKIYNSIKLFYLRIHYRYM